MTLPGLDRLAFRHQLALVVTLTSAMAIGLAALGTLGYEARRAYGDLRDDLEALARIIGSNSVGALAFNDVEAARETLGALAIKPHVVSARLYTAAGRPFATYRRAGADSDPVPPEPAAPGLRFEAGHLLIHEEIVYDNERVGTLYMKIDTQEGVARLQRTLGVLALGFLAATGVALLVSARLQRRVSHPVLELARAASAITERRDYSIRVEPSGPKELRALTLGFNEMLSEIQGRDTALRTAHDGLELRVAERVRDLQHEVVERRKAEAESELRAQRLQLQGAALESAADAVAITDRKELIQWVNPSFCSLMGYAAEELLGRNVEMFRSGRPEDDPQYLDLRATVRAGQVWDGELISKSKDGRLRLIAQTVTPVRDGESHVSHYVAVMRDVSERHRLEEQLRQAQKMEAVGQLSGGVAHDFNNLLNVILGFGEMLLKKLPADDARRRYGHEILKAANRGASLTRQLLAFSRQQVLQPKVIDLNAAVSDMQVMLGRLIGEDIDLVTALEPQLGRVEVDPGQIEQVIMNLAVNARDAMPQGGTLAIETTNVDLDESDVRQYDYPVSPGPYVRIMVCDTGTGMDAATLQHLFEPFFTTKALGKGTGLGLASVYGIVRQSNGFIAVESEPGRGTTFTMHFPAVPIGSETTESSLDAAGPAGGHETILLVEDEEGVRAVTSTILRRQGYRVLEAATPLAASSLFEEHGDEIDLLLTDVVMPEMSGPALAQRFIGRRPDLRVLLISGYANLATPLITSPHVGFLGKPFQASALTEKVRQMLSGARLGRT